MKNFLLSILALLYFSSSTGATIYLQHYNHAFKVAGFSHQSLKNCNQPVKHETAEHITDCCAQKNKIFIQHTVHTPAQSFHYLKRSGTASFTTNNFILPITFYYRQVIEHSLKYILPIPYRVAIYIRNCVFLI